MFIVLVRSALFNLNLYRFVQGANSEIQIALMQGSGAMATGIMVHVLSLPDSAIQAVTSAPCTVWLGGSAACDVIIATCMLYFVSATCLVNCDATSTNRIYSNSSLVEDKG